MGHFQDLFNLSTDLLCVMDSEGIFLELNPAWEALLGVPNLLAQAVFKWVHPEDAGTLRSRLQRTGESLQFRVRLLEKSGRYRWFEANQSVASNLNYLVLRDITELQRRELLLSQTESLSHIGGWELDLRNQRIYWSAAIHQIHETDPATFHPQLEDGLGFYHPNSRPVIEHALQELLTHGHPYDLELQVITAKKRTIWVRTRAEAEVYQGKVVRCYGSFQEITEEKKREASLNRFKEIVELAQEGIWDIDPEGVIIYVNRRVADMFGYSPNEMLGRPIYDFMEEEWQSVARKRLKRRRSGVKEIYEFQFRRKNGTPLWAQVSGRPRLNAEGQMISATAMISDISALKEREINFKEANERFDALVNNIPIVLSLFDENGNIEWVNQRWTEELGWTLEEMRGRDMMSEFYPDPSVREDAVRYMRSYAPEWRDFYMCLRGGRYCVTSWANVRLSNGKSIGIGQDVTKRKLLENQLREANEKLKRNNERLDLILEGASLGAWDWYLGDDTVIYDQRWCKMLGVRLEEIDPYLATWDRLVHPDDRERVHEDCRRYLEGEIDIYENVHRLRRADGTWMWVLDRGRISERDAEGKPARMSGTIFDFTAQKRVEEELRATKSEIEQFFSVAVDLLCVSSRTGIFKRVNPAFTQLLGYDAKELLGQSFLHLVHPEDIATTLMEMRAISQCSMSTRFENRFRTKSGEYKLLSWSSSLDPHSGLVYSAARDITELRRAELELRQTLSTIDKTATMVMTDREGRIIEVNHKFCQVSGYARAELIGQDHRVVYSRVHSEQFFEDLWSTISAQKTWVGEIQTRRKNGDFYWVQTVISPLFDAEGRIERYLAIGFEVTERKLAENKLIQSSKMASLGEMAGGVAHEINNPLAIIFAKAGQMRRYLQQGFLDPVKADEGLAKIEATADRIARIVRGLHSFSRNAENDPMLITSLSRIIDETLELCRERFKKNRIDLRVRSCSDVKIRCRAPQIAQVLMNLISNAHDAVEGLSERWVEVEVQHKLSFVRISVTDSGDGIAPELVEKIMMPFFTTKEVGKGTGLGLSISKGITEEHQGLLQYDSTCAHTRFVLELPCAAVSLVKLC